MEFIHNDVVNTRWPCYIGTRQHNKQFVLHGENFLEIMLVCNGFCYVIPVPVGYWSVSFFTSEI